MLAEAGDAASVLLVMEEGLRHRGLAGVVGEVSGRMTLTASRRLQLAAEASGVVAFVLRRSRRHDDPALVATIGGGHPLAGNRSAIAAADRPRAAGARAWPARAGASTSSAAVAGEPILDRGGLRCAGSSRVCLPTWPTDRLRRHRADAPPPDRRWSPPRMTAAG